MTLAIDGPTPTPAGGLRTDDKLAVLYTLVHRSLLGYVIKAMLGDRGAAEDIVQEAFIRAWRHLDEHEEVNATELRPWLFTVARHLVIDVLRARRSRPNEVMMDDLSRLPIAVDDIGWLVQAESLRSALGSLSADHRVVLEELYFHDRSAAEIAERISVPIGTVRSRSHYAKRALREYFDAELPPYADHDVAA